MNNISKKVVEKFGSFNGFATWVDTNDWTEEQKKWLKDETLKAMLND